MNTLRVYGKKNGEEKMIFSTLADTPASIRRAKKTAKLIGTEEMKQRFIVGQCIVGKIAANIFYSPAWLLKGVKFLAVKFIK